MLIGSKLRALREEKGLSQGDIERSTGLLRCYISRVENGHTVPSLETLERFAAALEIPLYQLFYSGDREASTPDMNDPKNLETLAEQDGKAGDEARFLLHFRGIMAGLREPDREVLLTLAKKLAAR